MWRSPGSGWRVKSFLEKILNKGKEPLEVVRRERDILKSRLKEAEKQIARFKTRWAPGHYYSPLPDLEEVQAYEKTLDPWCPEIPGVDLNERAQLQLLAEFEKLYAEQPFTDEKTEGRRYYFKNDFFSYSDAIVLYSMMRHFRPRRIIEIGSGFSSCAMLDINDLFFEGKIECLFIEPYPKHLFNRMSEEEVKRLNILKQKLQSVDPAVFDSLEKGDILFVDSSHVLKAGSDVTALFFRILPRLKSGVLVHFHDVMWPFEYFPKWLHEGYGWNEAYGLRAFLQYNQAFKIIFFNTYLEQFHEKRFSEQMPLCLKDKGGSIWLEKSTA